MDRQPVDEAETDYMVKFAARGAESSVEGQD